MVAPFPNPRYERKFLAEGFLLPELLALIRRHPAGFREAYPPRIVNNLYLDSPSLRNYHDHISGSANRSKTRVRWYGAPNGGRIEKPVLERKLKSGLVSGKTVEQLPAFALNGEGVRVELERSLATAGFPELLRFETRQLAPSLFNRYQRRYFISGNGRFRLTLDSELQFGAPTSESATKTLPRVGLIVLELKFGPDALEEAGPLTNALPFRWVRFSKYVLGIQRREPLGPGD